LPNRTVVGGLTLVFFFMLIVLTLLNGWPTDTQSDGSVCSMFYSKQAVTLYGVLIVGMLGGLVRHLLDDGIGKTSLTDEPSRARSLAGSLLLGAIAAIVAGILIPASLVETPGIGEFNPWALFVLSGIAGYCSRDASGELGRQVMRMVDQAAFGVDAVAVRKTVQEGVRDALSPPKRVNYKGMVALGISGAQFDGKVVYLAKDSACTLIVSFTASPDLPTGAAKADLLISGGIDAQEIPFELAVDYDFAHTNPERRAISVPSSGNKEILFEFRTPSIVGEGSDEPSAGRPTISVSIYQFGRFCQNVSLTVSM
jgi:hypothetical protein